MPGRLEKKIAIVTGSSSGIGRAISLAFAREGATVVCSDISTVSRNQASKEPEISTHDLISKEGGKAIFVKASVAKAEEVEALVKKTVEEFGRLDIMVNNAGTAIESTQTTTIWEKPIELWDQTFEVNARGTFLGCKYATGQMVKQDPLPCGDRGWIVNLASVYGLNGATLAPVYAASKHAVMGLTKSVALECAPFRIHVNAICPGFTNTAMPQAQINNPELKPLLLAQHPFRGFGEPEDIAKAALFLASEENSWITGIGLPVDGGFNAM